MREHTQKLAALQKMQTRLDPTKMSKMEAAGLNKLSAAVTKALDSAKQGSQELKKLKKLDTGTVAYSEGGKRGRRAESQGHCLQSYARKS